MISMDIGSSQRNVNFSTQSKDEIRKATTTMIRTLITLAQTIKPLPG